MFYNLKRGEATVTFIEPIRYPEKLSSLFYAVSLSDRVILVVDEISATLCPDAPVRRKVQRVPHT